ncbi:MAG TPA: hypothetical protein VG860_14375 [Terriglobia bacterium]|nr:hypothetical protein [Terriglobia bacterium]
MKGLIPSRVGNEPPTPLASVKKAHLQALQEAKIDPPFRIIRIYGLRITFGQRSAMPGVDLATLKELMGHAEESKDLLSAAIEQRLLPQGG